VRFADFRTRLVGINGLLGLEGLDVGAASSTCDRAMPTSNTSRELPLFATP
jgi:hypothetical protein